MTGEGRAGWVAVLAEAEGLRWVLEHARMAWTEASARRAAQVHAGDPLGPQRPAATLPRSAHRPDPTGPS
ncbi:MAG TPA: hypothetical protein VNO34_03325 [Actinomycetota bacterium]|nr:hypothetical protein [Actinomycetota bacterium]